MAGSEGEAPARLWVVAIRIMTSVVALAALLGGCGRSDLATSSDATTCGEPATTVAGTAVVGTTSSTAPMPILAVGESAVSGELEVVVRRTVPTSTVNNGLREGRFVIVDVALRNVGGSEQRYGPLDWVLETAGGRLLEPLVYADPGKLGFGVVSPAATTEGNLAFDVGDAVVVAVHYQQERGEGTPLVWAVTPTDLSGS